MKVVVKNTGAVIDEMLRKSARGRAAYRDANMALTKELAERSLAEAPEDTGELRQSIQITTQANQHGVRGKIEYTADHAIFVHEINKNYTIGKWKFLEDPYKEMLPDWGDRVSVAVASAMSSRGKR